jgi:hypothetical protein
MSLHFAFCFLKTFHSRFFLWLQFPPSVKNLLVNLRNGAYFWQNNSIKWPNNPWGTCNKVIPFHLLRFCWKGISCTLGNESHKHHIYTIAFLSQQLHL